MRHRKVGQRSPGRFLVSDGAAVYVFGPSVGAAVVGLAVLGRVDGFGVHSREAAPVVYSDAAPAPAVAAESHNQKKRSQLRV